LVDLVSLPARHVGDGRQLGISVAEQPLYFCDQLDEKRYVETADRYDVINLPSAKSAMPIGCPSSGRLADKTT
jgi:hypothetical protein